MDNVADRLRESLYAAVGFGVLGIQQAAVQGQVVRRELSKLAAEVDERVDPLLDKVEAKVSDDLRPLLVQARSAARRVQRTLLGAPSR